MAKGSALRRVLSISLALVGAAIVAALLAGCEGKPPEVTRVFAEPILARDPKTGKRFAFFPRKEVWKAEENPFSGVH